MRFAWFLVLLACATPTASTAVSDPARRSDGWSECSPELKAMTAPPAGSGCGLGPEGCAALAVAIAPCANLEPFVVSLAIGIETDERGAVTSRCLAGVDRPLPVPVRACVAYAFDGLSLAPARSSRVARFNLYDHYAFVDDGNGLPPDAVLGVIKAAIPGFDRCIDRQREADPKLHGKAIFAWLVDATGAVHDVKVLTREHDGTPVAACLVELFASLRYPTSARASATPVVMPVKF